MYEVLGKKQAAAVKVDCKQTDSDMKRYRITSRTYINAVLSPDALGVAVSQTM